MRGLRPGGGPALRLVLLERVLSARLASPAPRQLLRDRAGCRREFVPTRKDARWCSDSCRFRAYRARLAARAAEEAARAAARQASKDLAASLIG